MKKIIRKIVVFVGVLLWIITAVVFSVKDKDREAVSGKIVNTFNSLSVKECEAAIEGFGMYGVTFMNENAKKYLLSNIADKIDLNSYEINVSEDERSQITTLSHEGLNGDVLCQIISVKENISEKSIETKQYIRVKIVLKDAIDLAFAYKEKIAKVMKDLDINSNITVNLTGNINGDISIGVKNLLSDYLLNAMEAKVVTGNKDSELYTVYAFCDDISDYLTIGDEKVNVNITMEYDEINDTTKIMLASPIYNEN